MIYPIKMTPVFKDYLWGGDALATRYGKRTGTRPIAESWEISCYPGSSSVAANGPFKGKTLAEILELHPEMLGRHAEFPVLVKLIDARDKLSLQVHPDDAYARRAENQPGKNEMWYIVDCAPDAEIIAGFTRPVSRPELERAIREDTVLGLVRRVRVKPGDCYLIPAGLLHAIGAGIIIAEIQQSSDVTYRVYDYGRRGADGKPRELHVEKALDVIDTSLSSENASGGVAVSFEGYTETRLASWEYFGASLLRVDGRAALRGNADGFGCLLVTRGELELQSRAEPCARRPDGLHYACPHEEGCDISRAESAMCIQLQAGDSVFIPAGMGDYELSGRGDVLLAIC